MKTEQQTSQPQNREATYKENDFDCGWRVESICARIKQSEVDDSQNIVNGQSQIDNIILTAASNKQEPLLNNESSDVQKNKNPNSTLAAVQNRRGLKLQKSGKRDEAIAAFRLAVELNPTLQPAYFNLGSTLLQCREDFEDAEVALQMAVALDPDHFKAQFNLGYLYQIQGETEKALEHFELAVVLDKSDVDTWIALGLLYKAEGSLSKAQFAYKKALELSPDNVLALYNTANMFFAEGDIPGAIGMYKRCLEIQPNNADACFNLGVAYQKQNDETKALEYYKLAASIDSSFTETSQMTSDLIFKKLANNFFGEADPSVSTHEPNAPLKRSASNS